MSERGLHGDRRRSAWHNKNRQPEGCRLRLFCFVVRKASDAAIS